MRRRFEALLVDYQLPHGFVEEDDADKEAGEQAEKKEVDPT